MKITNPKNNQDIAKEWDNIAIIRKNQIESKKDTSFHKILLPNILKELNKIDNLSEKKLIDLGCGSGYLTNYLSLSVKNTVGIDISVKNIELAKEKYSKNNLRFYNFAIEDFQIDHYDIGVANMVLMDTMNLETCISSISNLLNNNGNFIFSITHPSFWPKYWKYEEESWYKYSKELIIEAEFRIANEATNYRTTHIHRPLETYINLLSKYNFKIESISELPNNDKDSYPRFLIVNCKKESG
ncbi:TPA: methyltransferase domain-containing protein [Streptococcus suis]|uniref:class I SAM-dependent methyltransferase n=1 Tax=Streptococcus suis TaxID=1307 RepID=UPI00209B3A9E|nr:class I SAM-dependent methyltransferase [Streptococcus suis]MCO8175159.1 class I SAM-dependent methyltransferase [Streptococcus suis]MCO8209042.1 class I SAM-dependent methyltransferase [Streptococcus suis]HEM3488538.1 methyltransferase domain-containing protein [Streptococcus suis]HEM3507239.1 methyltransferase domain-containing protein [Streptococcus suis]